MGKRFPRAEPRQRAIADMQGLLSPIERKNGWRLAAYAGDAAPYGVQHLLGRAAGSAAAVRDDLQPSAGSSSLFGQAKMGFMRPPGRGPDTVCQRLDPEPVVRFDHRPFPLPPLGLQGIQPGACDAAADRRCGARHTRAV